METIRSYSQLKRLTTFELRYKYLKLDGVVGNKIFGEERFLNQLFYKRSEWLRIRNHVIIRDYGLDLGILGYEIFGKAIIHHMNPVLPDDLKDFKSDILDPEFLITTSVKTHLAIHYGDKSLLPRMSIERFPGDTRLW